MLIRFLNTEQAHTYPVRDYSMIIGQLLRPARAESVNARITHVREVRTTALNHEGRHCRSHTVEFRMILGESIDAGVDGYECGSERHTGVGALIREINAVNNIDRHLAGGLAPLMTSYAVGNDCQVACAAYLDVGRLDVTVDHTVFMHIRNRLGDKAKYPHGFAARQIPAPLDKRLQGFTVDVLHDNAWMTTDFEKLMQ
jgi:hypothetical protein